MRGELDVREMETIMDQRSQGQWVDMGSAQSLSDGLLSYILLSQRETHGSLYVQVTPTENI